jgi:hypothetical protein
LTARDGRYTVSVTVCQRRVVVALFAVCFAASLAACTFVEVPSVSSLKPGEKVIVGDLELVEDEVSNAYRGLFDNMCLVLDFKLPVHEGRVVVLPTDGKRAWAQGPTPKGGAFRIGVENRTTYLLAFRVQSTVIVAGFTTAFPLLVEVPPSANRCEFVGTIRVHIVGRETHVEVVDTYDARKPTYEPWVEGCELKKAIGVVVTDAEKEAAIRSAAPGDAQPMVEGGPDQRRTCRDRQDFDENRNCILAEPEP